MPRKLDDCASLLPPATHLLPLLARFPPQAFDDDE